MPNYHKYLSDITRLTKAWKAVVSRKNKNARLTSRGIDEISLFEYKQTDIKRLCDLSKKITNKRYSPSPIKVKLIPKDKSKKEFRPICIPTIEDRIIQRALLDLIKARLNKNIDKDVNYFRIYSDEDETPVGAIQALINGIAKKKYFIFESDISKFYDSIPKKNIFELICKIVKPDSYTKKIIRKLIYFKTGNPEVLINATFPLFNIRKGVPQGNSLSPIFATIYLYKFDTILKRKYGVNYIRYVDDFIILTETKEEAKIAEKLVRKTISKFSLSLKEEKTHCQDLRKLKSGTKIKFLGLQINTEGLSPKNTSKVALNEKISDFIDIKDIHKDERYKNKLITKKKYIEEKIISWGQHYRFYHVKDLYNKLDSMIAKRTSEYGQLKKLSDIKLKPVCTQQEWTNLFKQ